MFGRIANGLDLAKASWGVLKLDKELLLFPILSGIACLAVVGGVAVTVILLILVSLLSSVLNTVVIAALYHYAASGHAPQNFESSSLQNAFQRR